LSKEALTLEEGSLVVTKLEGNTEGKTGYINIFLLVLTY